MVLSLSGSVRRRLLDRPHAKGLFVLSSRTHAHTLGYAVFTDRSRQKQGEKIREEGRRSKERSHEAWLYD